MMEVIMKNRLPVEHFHFPVEKIKAGYYTDAYFLRTEEILNGDNHHPRVMMQLFTREPVVVCGIDETIALIKTCAHNPENITIHALHDGDEVAPWETLMTIEGDLADFAHLEKILFDAAKPGGKATLTGKELGIPSLEKGKIVLTDFSNKEISLTPTQVSSRYTKVEWTELLEMLAKL